MSISVSLGKVGYIYFKPDSDDENHFVKHQVIAADQASIITTQYRGHWNRRAVFSDKRHQIFLVQGTAACFVSPLRYAHAIFVRPGQGDALMRGEYTACQ
jgi:hypothetical protein